MVRGENYLLGMSDEGTGTERLAKYAFFTTRFVEAADSETAANAAYDLIRRELDRTIENAPDDTPLMYIEKMGELSDFKGINAPGSGFIWYAEDDAAEDNAAS